MSPADPWPVPAVITSLLEIRSDLEYVSLFCMGTGDTWQVKECPTCLAKRASGAASGRASRVDYTERLVSEQVQAEVEHELTSNLHNLGWFRALPTPEHRRRMLCLLTEDPATDLQEDEELLVLLAILCTGYEVVLRRQSQHLLSHRGRLLLPN